MERLESLLYTYNKLPPPVSNIMIDWGQGCGWNLACFLPNELIRRASYLICMNNFQVVGIMNSGLVDQSLYFSGELF